MPSLAYDPNQYVTLFISDAGHRIYRIRCDQLRPLPGYAYLIAGDNDFPLTLVDCGTGENGADRELLAGIELVRSNFKENFALHQLRRIIITHAHIDHFGGAKELIAQTDAEIWCHQYDSNVLTNYDERAATACRRFDDFLKQAGVESPRRRHIINEFGFIRGRTTPVPVTRYLKDGEQFDGITVWHTPGHSPGHLCLQLGNSHLLLGDHILARTITQLWPEQTTTQTGYLHYKESVEKIAKLCGSMIGLPGHESIIDQLQLRIEIIQKSHHRRYERLLEIMRSNKSPMTIDQLARKMYLLQEGSQALLALTDVGARIEYLELIGHVEIANFEEIETANSDVYYWQPLH